MPDLRISTLASALLAWLLAPLPASAEAERWYLVELIVFAQPGGAGAEQWEPLPELIYTDQSRFLVERGIIARALKEHPGEAELDPFGRLIITLPGEQNTAVAPGDDDSLPGAAAQFDNRNGDSTSPRPTPFVTLGSQYQEFRGKAAYMQRQGGYRMLFHESWAQPVSAESAALPIVLDRSGDNQQWGQLQGSIKLYLSRYLHLHTNLWLNTGGEYLPGSWRMPAPPLGPPSIIIEGPLPLEELMPQGISADAAAVDPLTGEMVESPAAEEETGPAYPYRHAVRLQQKRRMRSREVHYIDHPMLGVIIQLPPLDDEALAQLAAEEAAAGELLPLSARR